MNTETIIGLIMAMAPVMGVDGKVAVAVARVESNFNINAIGAAGEIGLFQVKPEYVKEYTKKQLSDPFVNIYVGLQKLKYAQDNCIHQKSIEYLVCYNYGEANAKKIKYPHKFPYVTKVRKEMNRFEKGILVTYK